jgi:hypothetical protein
MIGLNGDELSRGDNGDRCRPDQHADYELLHFDDQFYDACIE